MADPTGEQHVQRFLVKQKGSPAGLGEMPAGMTRKVFVARKTSRTALESVAAAAPVISPSKPRDTFMQHFTLRSSDRFGEDDELTRLQASWELERNGRERSVCCAIFIFLVSTESFEQQLARARATEESKRSMSTKQLPFQERILADRDER